MTSERTNGIIESCCIDYMSVCLCSAFCVVVFVAALPPLNRTDYSARHASLFRLTDISFSKAIYRSRSLHDKDLLRSWAKHNGHETNEQTRMKTDTHKKNENNKPSTYLNNLISFVTKLEFKSE